MESKFSDVVRNPKKHKLQILYTQIDRRESKEPIFKTYSFGLDTNDYFYPASAIKLPIAVLAIEKANLLKEINVHNRFEIDPGSVYKMGVLVSPDSKSGYPSIAHSIRKMFVVSDNNSSNYMYDFLGRDYINKRLWDSGFKSVRMKHRLSLQLNEKENKATSPITFYEDSKILHHQQSRFAQLSLDVNTKNLLIGKKHYVGKKKKIGPLDFRNKNFMDLHDQHELIKRIIFPETYQADKRFNLSDDDLSLLRREMSILPRQSDYPRYAEYDKYYDGYCKFFMFGDTKQEIPDHIKIYNKIGLAYGFALDNAYIVDIDNNIEFFLTAVLYSNSNEVMNDNMYDYESISIPFLSELGRKVYNYESKREKSNLPRFGWVKKL
ncbi:MAG: serine hydrolase [Candidatus Neomarinimicrobiota bacterium]